MKETTKAKPTRASQLRKRGFTITEIANALDVSEGASSDIEAEFAMLSVRIEKSFQIAILGQIEGVHISAGWGSKVAVKNRDPICKT